MIRICDWTKRNTARLNHARTVRLDRGLDPMAPIALDGFTMNTAPSKCFLLFAEAVGLRYAEAFWQRVNEYCASRCAQTGEIRVPRKEFGRAVLSKGLDPIGRSMGEKVYDALVNSGLAALIEDSIGAGAVTPQSGFRDGTNGRAVPSQKPRRDDTNGRHVTTQAENGDVTKPPPVTSQSAVGDDTASAGLALAHDLHAPRTRRERAEHTREGNSRLDHPFGDVTGAVTCDAHDQTTTTQEANSAPNPERMDFEIRSICVDRGDERRAEARQLADVPKDQRKGPWLAKATFLLLKPRSTTKTVGMGTATQLETGGSA